MRSTRTSKRAKLAGLVALAGLIAGAGAGAGSAAHSVIAAHDDDMPWGVVKPLGNQYGQNGDMPWG
ncbi:hypothetical protein [Streptomyces sp. NPDC002644]